MDACVTVLESSDQPLKAEEIMARIQQAGVYEFKAKDPLAILRGTLRKHLRGSKPPRITQVSPGVFAKA